MLRRNLSNYAARSKTLHKELKHFRMSMWMQTQRQSETKHSLDSQGHLAVQRLSLTGRLTGSECTRE